VESLGEADDYDISQTRVIFAAKDPQLSKAMHTRQNVRALHILHFYANILPRRSTSLHTTEKTSEGSPRASNVRRTPLSSAPLAMKSPSWNWLLMGTREIGKLCDLFACRPDLNSRTCIYHSPIHSLHTLSTSRAQRESGGL